jgi:hypothetical protein
LPLCYVEEMLFTQKPTPESTPPGEPHREGAGDEGGVVFYSVRGKDGVLFEVLDDDLNVVGTLSMEDFIGAWEEQKNA